MSERATASFDITTWDEEPYDERDGVRLSHTRVVKAFRGEIEGESTAELPSGQVRIDNLPDGGHVLTLDYELG
ncbi:MAG: DUF3224 domain-containing protein [Actinomycetota bacterium]